MLFSVTSDVQSVNATAVGEFIIDIQCLFIHGSDALGCKVALVSDCSNISDVYANLSRIDMLASKQLTLIRNISCYHRVFAFDIDNDNKISNNSIEAMIKVKAYGVHPGKVCPNIVGIYHSLYHFVFPTVFICITLRSGLCSYYFSHINNTNHNPAYHNCSNSYHNLCCCTKAKQEK